MRALATILLRQCPSFAVVLSLVNSPIQMCRGRSILLCSEKPKAFASKCNHAWRHASQLSLQTRFAKSTQEWFPDLNYSLKPRFDLDTVQTNIMNTLNYPFSYKLYQWGEQSNYEIGLVSLSRLHTGVSCNVVLRLSDFVDMSIPN